MPSPAKLVIIGLDAGDKDLIMRWAAQGKLPNFKRVMDRATWGFTENPPGMEASSVWPSFYTGVSAAKHGMYYAFETPNHGTYTMRAFQANDFTAEPFWDSLSRAGKRVAVIDAPYTFLSQRINGAHVVDWATHAPMAGIAHFDDAFHASSPELAGEIEHHFGRDTIGHCELLHLKTLEDYQNYRDDLLERVRRKTGLNLYMLEKGDWDCFFTVYHESHCASQQCWHFHDTSHPRHDAEMTLELGDIIEQVYTVIDEGIGRILDRVGDETNVLLFCSNGMAASYSSGAQMLDDVLLHLEGFHNADPGKDILRALQKAWLRLSPKMQRRIEPLCSLLWPRMREVLEPKRSERKCFEVRNNNATSGIRLNLIGREINGQLQPGEDADRFCAELTKDLLALTLPGSDEPAVARVIRTADIFKGPRRHDLPDLLVEWTRDAPINGVCSPKFGFIDNKDQTTRTGDPRPVGVFFAMGPGYQATQLETATSVYSFAPTIVRLFGIDPAEADAPVAESILRGAGEDAA